MQVSLDSIVVAARKHISLNRGNYDLRALEQSAAQHSPRGFRSRLRSAAQQGIAIIAELKKASPSKGLIRPDFRPAELAQELELAGATALSVLTDEAHFQGSLHFLRQASTAASLPCLRKDFIVDEIQILEARANHADAILLIVAALSNQELTSLGASARKHDLDVLCEAHDQLELQRALDAGFDLIGINSRNLHTFQVDLKTSLQLAEKIPANCIRVAESGIHTGEDVARLRSAGYQAFLIGESLMKQASPGAALGKLMEEARNTVSTQ